MTMNIRDHLRHGAIAMVGLLLLAAGAGCAKPFRDVLAPGDDTHVEIDDPRGVDTWSLRTDSGTDVVVLRLAGSGVDRLSIQALLPGGIVAAQLAPPRGERFSIALSGRPATWTLRFRLREGESAPVRFRMTIERPSNATGGPRCADALRAKGIDAWILAIPGPPDAGRLVFPGLGWITLGAAPPQALAAGAPSPGAPPVLHVRGGTVLQAHLGELGCEPGQVQLNVWDTGQGKPPVLTVSDARGRPLCGATGEPACLSDPASGRWVSWSYPSTEPIGSLSLASDDLYLASIVIQ
jgi:hypothetical protein